VPLIAAVTGHRSWTAHSTRNRRVPLRQGPDGAGRAQLRCGCWAGGSGWPPARPGTCPRSPVWHTPGCRRPASATWVTQWPFLRAWDLAEAHERDNAVPVRWRHLRARTARDPQLRDVVEAAHEQPHLRALSPGIRMCWLTFSRRAASPISKDLPRFRQLSDGRYEVRFDDGRLAESGSADRPSHWSWTPSPPTPSQILRSCGPGPEPISLRRWRRSASGPTRAKPVRPTQPGHCRIRSARLCRDPSVAFLNSFDGADGSAFRLSRELALFPWVLATAFAPCSA
jgi:hypothetical protein